MDRANTDTAIILNVLIVLILSPFLSLVSVPAKAFPCAPLEHGQVSEKPARLQIHLNLNQRAAAGVCTAN
jgi:hypothetical protein